MDKLIINFYEILVSKKEIKLPYIQYWDADQLKNLKKSYPHATFKKDKNRIYFWNNDGSSPKEDGIDILSIENNFPIFLKIFEASLREQFYLSPTKFICKKKICYKFILQDQDVSNSQFQGLRFYRCFSINFQSLFYNSQNRLGFTISFSIKEVPS